MVTMVQAFLTHEKNDIDDAVDIVEHNQTHRKGRCKLEICCNFFQSVFLFLSDNFFSNQFCCIFQRRMLSSISITISCAILFHFEWN